MIAKYYTHYMNYYRITPENTLKVSANPTFPRIAFEDMGFAPPGPDFEPCTEDDFWETYHQVKEKLNKVVEQIPHPIKK